jgi:hypothetical protein
MRCVHDCFLYMRLSVRCRRCLNCASCVDHVPSMERNTGGAYMWHSQDKTSLRSAPPKGEPYLPGFRSFY